MNLFDMKLPSDYSVTIEADGVTLFRFDEIVHRYGPAWSPLCVVSDAWEHAIDIEDEISKLNELLRPV